jgi:hypothetical protein
MEIVQRHVLRSRSLSASADYVPGIRLISFVTKSGHAPFYDMLFSDENLLLEKEGQSVCFKVIERSQNG